MTTTSAARGGPFATTATSTQTWKRRQQPPAAVRARGRLLTDPEILTATLSLRQRDIPIEIVLPEPAWLYSMLDRFQHLSRLSDNWDSYGGHPTTDLAIFTALSLIARLLTDASTPPTIVPTSEGGVQLEWHRGGDELEIRVTPTGEISAFRFNEAVGELAELADVTLSDLRPLVELTGQL